ncbi:MAG TPA: hypothetical protein DCX17_01880 [Firmicutes bacterium]|jgi:hypothetical protein|nr:hypothetical protein [Bacillota bacterium]
MSERGMKKWAPYASLIEQKGTLKAMRYERSKVKKPHISNDQALLIERRLLDYQGEVLTITFFDAGFIDSCRQKILSIDPLNQVIKCESLIISYKNILAIDD